MFVVSECKMEDQLEECFTWPTFSVLVSNILYLHTKLKVQNVIFTKNIQYLFHFDFDDRIEQYRKNNIGYVYVLTLQIVYVQTQGYWIHDNNSEWYWFCHHQTYIIHTDIACIFCQ